MPSARLSGRCSQADMRHEYRGLTAKASTVSMLPKRLGATLIPLRAKGLVVQDGYTGGLIGWRLADTP